MLLRFKKSVFSYNPLRDIIFEPHRYQNKTKNQLFFFKYALNLCHNFEM